MNISEDLRNETFLPEAEYLVIKDLSEKSIMACCRSYNRS